MITLLLILLLSQTSCSSGKTRLQTAETLRLQRDHFGIAHIDAPSPWSAGYGVGVAQVDDHGLDLPLAWTLLSPEVGSVLTQEDLDQGIPRMGQVPPALQFDSKSFPLPASKMRPGAPTLSEIRRTLKYVNFFESTSETLARLENSVPGSLDHQLLEYLRGFVAGVEYRISSKAHLYRSSSDSRTQRLVSRGLHLRPISVLDPIRSAAAQTLPQSVGLLLVWANHIDRVQTADDPAPSTALKTRTTSILEFRTPPPQFTASNQFGISGVSTQSGRPILMVDPHLPMFGVWWNTALSAVVRFPGITFDAAIPVGQPVPFVGHALTPEDGSGFALTGTANAQSPSTCWYAPVPMDLSSYRTAFTPEAGLPFQIQEIEGLTIREAPDYGRLIGHKRTRIGNDVVEVGLFYRESNNSKYSMIETLWPAFFSRTVSEFHAALDRHAHPFWNMVVGFSTPSKPSTVLYINNQVSARRDPDPDGNPLTTDDWGQFMNAMNPRTRWLGGVHSASELPQIVAEDHERSFLHCHNCSSELVTRVTPTHPYMVGGYLGYSNPRHDVGELVYTEATAGGQKLSLSDAIPLANHKRDLQLEELVSKVTASFESYSFLLDQATLRDAEKEISLWQAGPVVGTLDNPRIARVMLWLQKMRLLYPEEGSHDLRRILTGIRYPESLTQFDPGAPLGPDEALVALSALAQVSTDFAIEHGSDSRTWGEIHRFRPHLFGAPLGDFALAGSPEALLSVGGPLTGAAGARIYSANGGQNYVQLVEVGKGSLLKKSTSGAGDPSLAYSSTLSTLFAAEEFTPTGVGPLELPQERVVSTEQLQAFR